MGGSSNANGCIRLENENSISGKRGKRNIAGERGSVRRWPGLRLGGREKENVQEVTTSRKKVKKKAMCLTFPCRGLMGKGRISNGRKACIWRISQDSRGGKEREESLFCRETRQREGASGESN